MKACTTGSQMPGPTTIRECVAPVVGSRTWSPSSRLPKPPGRVTRSFLVIGVIAPTWSFSGMTDGIVSSLLPRAVVESAGDQAWGW